MSFNGSGTFVINSAGQPVVSGTVISSTAFNALTADLANGLSTCITKDGQTTPTADIPMGSNKITGLANGTAAGDAANLGQVQSTVAKLLGSVSGADTITAVGSPTVAAYAAGQMFYFVAAAANTGAVTINIDSLGAKSITRDGTTALAAGDIQSGEVCVIVYDGTQFQLVNGASQSASIVTENLTVNKATVLNESGGDNDTRIEGDTDPNLLFVDASADAVGIGTSSPGTKLDVAASGPVVRITDTRTNGAGVTYGTLEWKTSDGSAPSSGIVGKIDVYDEGSGGTGYGDRGAMRFYTNNSSALGERARITSGGNLLVGTTSTSNITGWSGSATGQVIQGATPVLAVVDSDDTTNYVTWLANSGGVTYLYNKANDALVFGTNNAERARITSGGDWLVNCTGITNDAPNAAGALYFNTNGSLKIRVISDSLQAVQFYSPTGGTSAPVGNITVGASSVSYNTSSDRRLKENITAAPEAGAKIDAIEIVSHDWKSAPDEHVEFGVVAQDLYAVAPQAVSVGDDGEEVEKTWGVDYSKLVPMLVKEIQSLRARVAALEGAN